MRMFIWFWKILHLVTRCSILRSLFYRYFISVRLPSSRQAPRRPWQSLQLLLPGWRVERHVQPLWAATDRYRMINDLCGVMVAHTTPVKRVDFFPCLTPRSAGRSGENRPVHQRSHRHAPAAHRWGHADLQTQDVSTDTNTSRADSHAGCASSLIFAVLFQARWRLLPEVHSFHRGKIWHSAAKEHTYVIDYCWSCG